MVKQRPWDQYEAVILLEAYIQVYEGKKDRNKAICEVSNLLRRKAFVENKEINETIRNIAGITFQMFSIESAFHGYTIRKPATKLFAEVVWLRKNDRTKYETILKEAKTMVVAGNRNEYQNWLISNGMTNVAARNYGNWLNNIDLYAQEQNYSNKSIYEYENVDELVEIHEKLSADTYLVVEHRDYLTSYRKYILYRSNGEVKLSKFKTYVSKKSNAKRYEYQEWLVANGMKETAARNYGNWLNNIDAYSQENGYSEKSIYDIEELAELIKLHEELNLDTTLLTQHRDYLTSFRKFIAYKSGGSIELFRKRATNITVEKSSAPKEELEVKILSDETRFGYLEILKKFFEDGLVPNAIRLDKFRMLYEDEFGKEISKDDDVLLAELKLVGTYVDGRIYPKHEGEQNSLVEAIRTEIVDILSNGASCVYISCILEKWKQELANNLSVYNEVALRDMIMAENMSGVYATTVVFKLTSEKVYPEKDVLDFMKSRHTPTNYCKFQEKLWYIPIDVIKHILVSTPSLVLVDWETYLYAPNFPVSHSELQRLIQSMKNKIAEKGFLVSKDIAEIIHVDCPTIAINTENYKDWAYRNILKYILRDEFEFSGSVVSDKGRKVEMWQLYQNFCRDYEKLTIFELKQFSNDIGVQIYWDTVLNEMIRINENELIRKDLIHFNVDAIDNVLEIMCPQEYKPITQVGLFLHFPTIEYPWNIFVLESYLKYSKKFKLYHVSYSENGVFGFVVRQESQFEDYRQVIIDFLAKNTEWDNVESALTLIVDNGCQARKRWSGFEKVMQEALAAREKNF